MQLPDTDANNDSDEVRTSTTDKTNSVPGLVAYDVIEPVVIVVDPGHGGIDPGTQGQDGLLERELTLDIAKRLQTLASLHSDIDIVLTRDDGTGLSRAERIGKVTDSGADLLLSLHFNHLPQSNVTLVESYYADPRMALQASALRNKEPLVAQATPANNRNLKADNPAEMAAISKSFATHMQSGVFRAVQGRNPLAIDAGVKRQSLYLLTQSGLPGALVELTCLSNPQEESRLRTEQYRNELAHSLMQSLRKFVDSEDLAKSI